MYLIWLFVVINWIPRCKNISCRIFSRLLTDLYLWFILRVRTESWIHWNFPSNFPNLKKKSGKMVNSLGFFFFSKLQHVLYKWNFHFDQILFNLARTFAVRCEKSFVLLITYLITFSLEKEIIVWKKNMEKSLEFWIQKSAWTLCTCVYVNVLFFCNARSILSD